MGKEGLTSTKVCKFNVHLVDVGDEDAERLREISWDRRVNIAWYYFRLSGGKGLFYDTVHSRYRDEQVVRFDVFWMKL